MPMSITTSNTKFSDREQGDINTTKNRKEFWKKNLTGETEIWFEEDKKYFLHIRSSQHWRRRTF